MVNLCQCLAMLLTKQKSMDVKAFPRAGCLQFCSLAVKQHFWKSQTVRGAWTRWWGGTSRRAVLVAGLKARFTVNLEGPKVLQHSLMPISALIL